MPKPVPSLAAELHECERSYLAFLVRYCSGDETEAALIAAVSVVQFRSLLAKHALKCVPQAVHLPPPTVKPRIVTHPRGEKTAAILKALRKPMTIDELHGIIGGPRTSLSALLGKCKVDGKLKSTPLAGPGTPHRWSVA